MEMRASGLRDWRAASVAVLLLLLPMAMGLTGEHVCHRVENYTVSSPEQYVEPVEVHTLAWCLQIPPRCPQTRTELRERWRTKTEVKFKSVPVCCEGYRIQEPVVPSSTAEAKCVPDCKNCRNGACTGPDSCTCDPGYQGQGCDNECQQGTWGQNCANKCNCLIGINCNHANGECECPAGWIGSRCESKCPEGRWGAGCSSICTCENQQARCHHETGECGLSEPDVIASGTSSTLGTSSNSPIDPFEASGISDNLVSAVATIKIPDIEYNVDVIDFDKETALTRANEDESETPVEMNLPDQMIPVQRLDVAIKTTESLSTKTIEEKPMTQSSTSPLPALKATSIEGNQLSLPEDDDNLRKRKDFDFDDRHANFRVIVSPKTEYVKTTQKGGSDATMSAIPIDVAAMIVVGAIVSIGLTSVAALMIFHVRSRLLKAALSIYNQEKVERQYVEKETVNGPGNTLDVNIGTLPRTLTRVNPVYEANPDSSILTFEERQAEYANGTVTIGIRLSSNLRDLLESQYDRPASCSQRTAPKAPGETDVEHVYDEIPLSAPFYFAKDT